MPLLNNIQATLKNNKLNQFNSLDTKNFNQNIKNSTTTLLQRSSTTNIFNFDQTKNFMISKKSYNNGFEPITPDYMSLQSSCCDNLTNTGIFFFIILLKK